MRKNLSLILTPVLFLCIILIDAQVSRLFGSVLKGQLFPMSNLIWIILIPAMMKFTKRYLVLVMLFLGIVVDMYYYGIIGINALLFPLITYYLYDSKELINLNIFSELFGLIIVVAVYHAAIVGIEAIFRLAKVNLIDFIVQTMGPTLLLNILLFFIFILLFRKIYIEQTSEK